MFLKIPYKITFFAIAVLATSVKLFFIYKSSLPLWVDEAQYWLWSQNLEAGYYSKPPMISWIINFTTAVFSNNEFGVRASAPIIHLLTAFIVYFTAKECFNEEVAAYSGISYITIPAVTFSSTFISSDVPLMFFWALGLYFFVRINKNIHDTKFIDWLMLGFCFGLGMLSKYTFVAFVFSAMLYYFYTSFLVIFSMNFIGAAIVGLCIFLPNILWNYNNNFASFSHTSDNVFSKTANIYFYDALSFIGGQVLIFGFIISFFLLIVLFKKNHNKKLIFHNFDANRLLKFMTIPLLVAGVFVSLISGAQIHWAAPAYIAGNILVVNFLLTTGRKFWFNFSLILNAVIFAIALNSASLAEVLLYRNNPFNRVYLWHKPTETLKYSTYDDKSTIIIADERKIIAPLIYDFAKAEINTKIYKWNPDGYIRDYYDMKMPIKNTGDYTVFFVTRSKSEKMMRELFKEVSLFKVIDEELGFKIYKVKYSK